jgi:glycosyltransferase involved in cell wall biosynthesis
MPTDRLKVLHLSTWNVRCGIASYCANLVKSLSAAGIDSEVFALHPHEWRTYHRQDELKLLDDLQKQAANADVVHIQHEHGLFGASRNTNYALKKFSEILSVLRKLDKPVVTTFHTEPIHNYFRKPKWYRGIAKWLRNKQWQFRVGKHFGNKPGKARAIVHSNITRFRFLEAGFPVESMHVMPHACNPQRKYAITPAEAKASLGLPKECKLLTIFGFLGEYKGHDIAIDTLRHLPQHFRLAIVGGSHPEARDKFLSELLSTINKLDETLRERIMITGYVDNETANNFYAATDICLAPYRAKTLLSASGAITWALSSGKPVIASKIDAFQVINRDCNGLFMVSPEEIEEMAWACQRLAADPGLCGELVSNAGQYCDEHSWANTANKTIALYEELLGRSVTLSNAETPHLRLAS